MRRWIIRWLLRLYPAEFRQRYGKDLLHTFDASQKRGGEGGRFWATTVPDLVINAAREHLSRPGNLRRAMGLAGMIGGLLWTALHTPLGLSWFALPAFTLICLLGGLYGVYLSVGSYDRWRGVGFALAAAGLLTTFAGYIAAWHFGWQQSGLPTLLGAALQSAGLLLISGAAPARLYRPLILIGLVNAALTMWLLIFLYSGMLLEVPAALIGILIQGVVTGLCWAAMGYALWLSADYVPQTA